MKVLVSRCLLGEAVRWHGKAVRRSPFLDKWASLHRDVEWVPVCPEVLGGLSVPRAPVKRRGQRVWITCADKKRRNEVTGAELTREFEVGANRTLEIAVVNECRWAILCKWSPSCDISGLTGRLLSLNGITVINTF